jgi:MFS family permease
LTEVTPEAIVAERDRIGTFGALQFRNFRLWFIGQTLSMMGTWMQSVAQGYVVFQLTNSEFALGAVTFAGSLPTLFLMLFGGVAADRIPKRRLLLMTQTTMMVLAFILAGLAVKPGVLQVWHVAVLAVLLGLATSFDAPARQAMAVEMVEDRRYLMNAIALNSTIFNMARVVGPAVGGVVLAAVGAAWCFGLNGLSFVAVLAALLMMHFPTAPAITVRAAPVMSQLREGIDYVWQNVPVRAIIIIVCVSSIFAASYSVLLPAYAQDVMNVGAVGLGALNVAVGVGALVGSLVVASMAHFGHKIFVLAVGAIVSPAALVFFAGAPGMPFALACLVVVGLAIVAQNAMANTTIQMLVPDDLRGRVMAVYMLTFFGTVPFGALQAGVLAQAFGTRIAIGVDAGITVLVAALVFLTAPALRKLEY